MLEYWPIAVVAGSVAVGYGDLRARVARIRDEVDAKASREVNEVQYTEILRRLGSIETRLDRRKEE